MPSTRSLTSSDRALLLALRCWSEDPGPVFWQVFDPAWAQALGQAWDGVSALPRETMRLRLSTAHQAEAVVELGRIHPTWWVRALKDESPAVQRAVAAHAPEALRARLCEALGLAERDLRPDRPPQPEALRAAGALWSERLVGGRPDPADPPVIAALTSHSLRSVARLVHATGLAKCALAAGDQPIAGPGRGRDRAWVAAFQARIARPGAAVEAAAQRDVARYGHTGRHGPARLGLLTVARLLDGAEPYRVRWALQHLPYPVAKYTRSLMSAPSSRSGRLLAWEGQLLQAAADLLRERGQLQRPEGGPR